MTTEEVVARFGVNPHEIGFRNRGWWIVAQIDDEEESAGAVVGDLCVKARDGALNPMDVEAIKQGYCIGTVEDGFDSTYRYYYYRALPQEGR